VQATAGDGCRSNPFHLNFPRRDLAMTKFTPLGAIVAALSCCFHVGASANASNATAAEATAMVKKGIAFIKANGKDKGYAEISNKSGQFTDRDLYLVVYGLDGTVRAHGANEKMIGKNLIELKDVDGKPFVKERVELAQSKGTFWQDYKFTNPVSKKIEPKSMYCEKLEDAAVCGGIYK
jgi:signal transduction histidine kinase